ncbi:MAG: bifunctional oligoribonuclease/PAP phosphatase NrnA [Ignavibacteriae bacterium HGW-Ignavibacteriae-3]|nr:MAG: bifunctional oligoribonuclease/PAP phosphatase NrnA [Ignavibacteriae bacterium HGW-Ignavibacteriae-3]
MNDFASLKKIIEEHNSFLLSTHVNPDADAIGSEIGFYLILKKLGKKIRIINHSATPYNLEFLDPEKVVEKFDENTHSSTVNESEVFVLLDLNQGNRIASMENAFRSFKGLKVCIDHHQDTENVFDYVFGGTQYSATAEIIYDFIEETKIVELDHSIALQLYAGIMTDTGSFRFDRTSPRIHHIMAELLGKGVSPTDVYDKIYDQFKFGRVKLLGEALSTIQLDDSGNIAYMIVTKKDLDNTGASEADVDGFVNYCLTIRGVKIGILFYELKDGIKISFRSKGEIQVNKLAKEFKGGGHTNASGIRLFNTTIDDVKDQIISAAKRYL